MPNTDDIQTSGKFITGNADNSAAGSSSGEIDIYPGAAVPPTSGPRPIIEWSNYISIINDHGILKILDTDNYVGMNIHPPKSPVITSIMEIDPSKRTLVLNNSDFKPTINLDGTNNRISVGPINPVTIDGNTNQITLGNTPGQPATLICIDGNAMRINMGSVFIDGYHGQIEVGNIFINGFSRQITAGSIFMDGNANKITMDSIVLDANAQTITTGSVSIDGNAKKINTGSILVDGNANQIHMGSSILIDGNAGDVILQNADCAEDFEISPAENVEPGTVMALNNDGKLVQGKQPYDKRVAGVVSGAGDLKPGLVLGRKVGHADRVPLALMGRVNCKVDAAYGSIEVGDLLTTSSTPGHAMKANNPAKAFGAVIGKALKPLEAGCDLIPILVALQ